jgi:hypothetical protein
MGLGFGPCPHPAREGERLGKIGEEDHTLLTSHDPEIHRERLSKCVIYL